MISWAISGMLWAARDDRLEPPAFEQSIALVAPDDLAPHKAPYPRGQAEHVLQRNQPEPPQRLAVLEQAQPQLIRHPHPRRRHREQDELAPLEGRGEEQQHGPGQAVGESLPDVTRRPREARTPVPPQPVFEAAREAQRRRVMIDRV